MKYILLLQIKNVLIKIIDVRVPFKLAYKIYKFIEEIEREEKCYTMMLNSILTKYGQKDNLGRYVRDDNGNIKIKSELENECQLALTQLNNIEVDIPPFSFTIKELEPLHLSVNDINLLRNFILEE